MIDLSKKFEDLTFCDDFMFGKTMEDKDLCRAVIECLLQRKIGELEDITPQREFRYTTDGKPIRLDIYTGDGIEIYDAEMQNLNHKTIDSLALPKRLRFYQSSIDTDHLNKNQSYKTLPDSNILFICTFDPFGLGLSTYTFNECCQEADGVKLEDGTTKILYNCTYQGNDIPVDLYNLYKYIETGDVTDDLTYRIDNAVQVGRRREEWRSAYMKERALIMDLLEEAHEETAKAKEETNKANQRADIAENEVGILLKWFKDNNIPVPDGIHI